MGRLLSSEWAIIKIWRSVQLKTVCAFAAALSQSSSGSWLWKTLTPVKPSWKIHSEELKKKSKLGKNITCHYLPKGFTVLFLLTVTAILVNELPRKIIYQVIIFTQWIRQAKALFPRRSTCCCWAAENFSCGFDFHYK